MEFYYSALASPSRKIWIPSKQKDDQNSDFDDFEFETSNKFSGCLAFEWSKKFEGSGCNQDVTIKERHREREDSLPSMAFADELFLNGLAMPLELPPRLQYDIDAQSISLRLFASTPIRQKKCTG
ncbi:Hypothetical predicted protein [Olea europaea subsp. europaea]|uniref:Uncharacterized protein n=1 Tax=Olea europaea subsp. europaea TaxID=158383 RepID=A0A8S0SJC5_OLEEU|nr:Hypothetical predicted protein [Olea europaea subsp. europaea]